MVAKVRLYQYALGHPSERDAGNGTGPSGRLSLSAAFPEGFREFSTDHFGSFLRLSGGAMGTIPGNISGKKTRLEDRLSDDFQRVSTC
jgi:hypothetical protein